MGTHAPAATRMAARRAFSTWLSSGAAELASRGAGGRASVSGVVATVFGATGFLGRYVVNRLGRSGTQVVVPWRGDGLNYRHLKLMGDLGQIVPMEWEMRDDSSIRAAVRYADVVINLVGKHYETRNYSFEDVHVEGAAKLARLAREAGVSQFVHVSAANAKPDSNSPWLRSKLASEDAVRAEFPNAVVIRPTHMFGYEDRLVRRIGIMILRTGMFPLVNGGKHTIQPVYVDDVAAVIAAAVRDPEGFSGRTVELGGADRVSMGELCTWFNENTKQDGALRSFPAPLAKFFATVSGMRLPLINTDPIFVLDDVLWELENPVLAARPDPGVFRFEDIEVVPVGILSDTGREILRMFRRGGDRSSLFYVE